MKLIKAMSEMIEEELEGAERYARFAIMEKEKNPALAKVIHEISAQEMNHVSLLHTETAKVIEQYRKEHGEPPAAMAAVYDYLHERHIRKAHEIKLLQSEFMET